VTSRPIRILFVCAENSSRSQMAEAWMRQLGADRFMARSAGLRPTHLHPLATAVMQEADVDIARQRGKGLDAVKRERFDIVVTLCEDSADELPDLPGSPAVRHHPVDDPTWIETDFGADIDEFRKARDKIRAIAEALIREL
jgi:protein-tyrosine-phosphatase